MSGGCRGHTVSERLVIRCQGGGVGCTQSLRERSLGVRGGVGWTQSLREWSLGVKGGCRVDTVSERTVIRCQGGGGAHSL